MGVGWLFLLFASSGCLINKTSEANSNFNGRPLCQHVRPNLFSSRSSPSLKGDKKRTSFNGSIGGRGVQISRFLPKNLALRDGSGGTPIVAGTELNLIADGEVTYGPVRAGLASVVYPMELDSNYTFTTRLALEDDFEVAAELQNPRRPRVKRVGVRGRSRFRNRQLMFDTIYDVDSNVNSLHAEGDVGGKDVTARLRVDGNIQGRKVLAAKMGVDVSKNGGQDTITPEVRFEQNKQRKRLCGSLRFCRRFKDGRMFEATVDGFHRFLKFGMAEPSGSGGSWVTEFLLPFRERTPLIVFSRSVDYGSS